MRRFRICLMVAGWVALAAGIAAIGRGSVRVGGVASAADTQSHGFDLNDLDTTCKPCQDFFQYATGGWIERNPIQPAYPSWGRFNALQNKNQDVLRQILEAAAKDKQAAPGSIEQKIGDFYGSCMDAKRIEKAGHQAP